MAKNTNNSLSDLNNQGTPFNRNLRDDEISQEGQSAEGDRIKNNDATIKANRDVLRDYELHEEDKIALEKGIEDREADNRFLKQTGIRDLADMTSLFNRNAIIDYGRYIKSDGSVEANWKHYNSTVDGKGLSFSPNSEITAKNTPVKYKDNSLDSDDGLSLQNLIAWSEKYPALQLKFQDFAYCKKLGYYPNNRLIVLRRFKAGVPDNLFDYVNESGNLGYNQPLSTMVTWWKPDEEIGDMTFNFNEEWKTYDSGLMDTFKESLSNLTGGLLDNITGGDSKTKKSAGANDLITALLSDKLTTNPDFRREDGTPYTRSGMGNPNLIYEAMVRKTGGDGLKSEVKFNISFEYEMRDINGIDPGIAMLDLISNCTRMGTTTAEFRYNIPILKESESVKALINGNVSKASKAFKEDIKKFTSGIKEIFTDVTDNLKNASITSGEGLGNIVSSGVEYIISRYRENLKAALSVETGLPSGIWHITIGSPKSPIISCGDLVLSSSTLKLGNELGYNDFPNSFKIDYTLDSARTRGRDELTRIFNAGRGRVYVYDKAIKNPDYDLYDNGSSKGNEK